MSDDDFHQPLRQTAATMLRQNECVSYPGKGRVVRHDARETNLLMTLVDSKRQRVFNRALHHFARATFTPVRLIAAEVVNQIEIKAGTVWADPIFAPRPRVWLPLPFCEGGWDGLR